ncbi:MAG: secretion protein, partial [Bacteroidetes bacterium]|nr:secretion protein [Bacteroidota bacterium]
MKRNLFLISALLLAFGSISQGQNFWKKSESKINEKEIIINKVEVTKFDVYSLDYTNFCQTLRTAPMRGAANGGKQLIISFPNTEGGFDRYSVVEAPVMDPLLAAKYPGIYSYAAQGIDNKLKSIRFSVSYQRGLYGMIFDGDDETNFIDPYTNDFSNYMVYRKKDMIRTAADDFECSLTGEPIHSDEKITTPKATNDSKLRTYRLALSCNGEYGALFIGTATTDAAKKANILAQMNITMTRVNGVYEKDLAITMVIIANNNLIMYYDATTDPWSGEFNIKTAQTIDAAIGIANYDIGHNFNTSGGGNAGCIGCVCMGAATSAYYTANSMHKGKGMTGRSNPTGDAFDIDYVAHEMGHQFGGWHTMNTCSRSGSGTSEVEPTSGSTIMGYAGICTYNIQSNSDDYFAYVNIRDISANVQTGNSTCGVQTTLTNLPPTANAGLDYTIPKGTAFVLTGSGTDPNGDPLTYTWEQNDPAQAPAATAPVSTWTAGPLFRSIKGTSDPKRYFPSINYIIANNLAPAYEIIPTVGRTMNFSLVTRDNVITGGQTANDLMVVTVNGTAGPFTVSTPNTAVTWASGSTQTVTWAVAGTTASPVSCANVDIFLSTDGGYTYPTTLLAGTANSGTATITVPNLPSTTCRVMVRGANNIFFDISNANFTITGTASPIISTSTITTTTYCAGATVSVPYTISGSSFTAGNIFTAQLSNSAGSFATPVAIGTLTSTAAGTISATIPVGTAAGTGYRIRVIGSTPASTGTDNGANITINAVVTPAVSIAASATAICAGTSVTFTPTPTNGGTPTYQWKVNGANVGTGATYSSTTLATGNIVSCVMTSTAACPSTPTATSNSVTMTVNPTVTPAITIAASASTICSGSSVTFTPTPVNGGTPTYQWKVNGTNVGTGATYTS